MWVRTRRVEGKAGKGKGSRSLRVQAASSWGSVASDRSVMGEEREALDVLSTHVPRVSMLTPAPRVDLLFVGSQFEGC